jgi:hypothetical protein
MRSLVETADASTDRAADQRSLLAVNDPADAGTGGCGSTNDQRALPPRPMRAPVAISRNVPCSILGTIHTAAQAFDSGHRMASNERVANHGVLT